MGPGGRQQGAHASHCLLSSQPEINQTPGLIKVYTLEWDLVKCQVVLLTLVSSRASYAFLSALLVLTSEHLGGGAGKLRKQ